MSRREAIQNIIGTFQCLGTERCVGAKEHEDNDREMVLSLAALGVTADELPEPYRKWIDPTELER